MECWALAAKALFHRALMSREARYRVWDSDRNREGKPRCETDNTQDLSRIIDRNATSCCGKDPWFLLLSYILELFPAVVNQKHL